MPGFPTVADKNDPDVDSGSLLSLLHYRDDGDPVNRFAEPWIDGEIETRSTEPGIGEIEILEDKDRGRPAEKGTVACPPLVTVEGG